jgi:hypothetical protein
VVRLELEEWFDLAVLENKIEIYDPLENSTKSLASRKIPTIPVSAFALFLFILRHSQ